MPEPVLSARAAERFFIRHPAAKAAAMTNAIPNRGTATVRFNTKQNNITATRAVITFSKER